MKILFAIVVLVLSSAVFAQTSQKLNGTQLIGQQLGQCMAAQAQQYDEINALNQKIDLLTKENTDLQNKLKGVKEAPDKK